MVRSIVPLAFLIGCTLNGRGPDPVTKPPPPDPDRMPSGVLDHQDPGADTSNNPILSRTEAHYVDPNDYSLTGCLRRLTCSTGDASGGLVVVLAIAFVTRRRRIGRARRRARE